MTAFIDFSALIPAFCYALLHSLWAGTLAAFGLWLLLPALSSSVHRYRAAMLTLLLIAAFFAGTIVAYYQPSDPATLFYTPTTVATVDLITLDGLPPDDDFAKAAVITPTWNERLSDWVQAHARWFVALWSLGFCVFALRLAGSFWVLYQLRHHAQLVTSVWADRLAQLCAQFDLSQKVTLATSVRVQTPVALGWLRPMILLPVGLLNQLTPAQVEAVLAHELAHIRRFDWIFNVAQTLIETILYHHPAVWWISAIARRERENCCDDLAVAIIGDRLIYAKTLVQLQDFQHVATPRLALALLGKNSRWWPAAYLLLRVQRLLKPVPSSQQQYFLAMEKFTVTLLLLLGAACIGLYNQSWPSQAMAQPVTALDISPEGIFGSTSPDTLVPPKRSGKVSFDDGKQQVDMKLENDEVVELAVDGKKVTPEDIKKYVELTKRILADLRATPPIPPTPPVEPALPAMPSVLTPPAAPIPPSAPGGDVSVTTVKENGRTIVRINQNGVPTEIVVSADVVTIDGRTVKDGEQVYVNGHVTDLRGLEALSSDLSNIHVDLDDIDVDDMEHGALIEARAKLQGDMTRLQSELQRVRQQARQGWKEREAELRKDLAEMSVVMAELREKRNHARSESIGSGRAAAEQGRAAAERSRIEADRARTEANIARIEADRARAEADIARRDADVARREADIARVKADAMQKRILAELKKDGLLTDPENFKFELSKSKLKVNGEKQSDALHQKYMKLYEEMGGNPMTDKSTWAWERSNK
jgi:bla regulator protein blaR1